ncbi:PREDICTED: cell division cycle protein 123 homolog isoform X3 [Capra hircus]|uniref:cell division cycle protein 123 homolog isoform X3 n=1 Tax=Capra hircus TaxID=9925 RepID=UPI0006B13CB4|nr:PREDICTED: cell division cycle protein 123 homolog isoform X3 [Capra hircus]
MCCTVSSPRGTRCSEASLSRGKTHLHVLSQTVMMKPKKYSGRTTRTLPRLRHQNFLSLPRKSRKRSIPWGAVYFLSLTGVPQGFIHCTDDSPDPCMEYELVLRKWCELIPGAEFRCFVKENKLIGISQRDYTQYYDHISKQKEEICRCIQDFFKKHIQYKFLDEDFVFDIYRDSRGKVWLIDFNPFGEVTDSLLFTWDELLSGTNLKGDFSEGEALEQDAPAFRCTNSEVTVQPSPYLSYRLPKDFVDLSTGEDAHKLIDFLKLKRNQQEDD